MRATFRTIGIADLQRFARRLLFVACVASVLVVWSEKAFWYVQGWGFAELVAVYALPAATLLWVVDRFPEPVKSGETPFARF